MWIGIYIIAIIVAFVLGFISKIVWPYGPFYKNPMSIKWDETVGTIYTDFVYGEADSNKFDLYVPADNTREFYGLVVYLHAGGFTGGDKSGDAKILQYFASKGYVAAGINYTLRTNENTASITTMSEEIKQRIPVVVAEAEKLGYGINKMAISGGSAGACLAMIYAYRDADTSPVPVTCVMQMVGPSCFEPEAWYGMSGDFDTSEASTQGAAWCSVMTGDHITPEMMQSGEYKKSLIKISPYELVTENSVPTLCAYGVHDKIVPFATVGYLLNALEENKVPYDYIEFPRSGHGCQNDPKQMLLYAEKLNEYLNKYMPIE